MLEFEVLQKFGDLEKLRCRWNALLESSGHGSIYLTWEWLSNWWRVYGKGRELFVILARDGTDLCGIFPLVRRFVRPVGLLGYQRLEFLGTGEKEAVEVCSNYMDFIVAEGNTRSLVTEFLKALTTQFREEWNELYLANMLRDSETVHCLAGFFKAGRADYAYELTNPRDSLCTDLGGSWESLLSSLGRKTRKNLRTGLRSLETEGNVTCHFSRGNQEVERDLDDFIELHRKRWRNRGAFAQRQFAEFQRLVCREFSRQDRLRLSLLKANGKNIAGNLDFAYRDTVFGYQTAYDPNWNSRASAGILGMAFCLQDAIANGYKIYDWFVADENSYKQHLANKSKSIVDFRCARKTAQQALLGILRRINHRLRDGRKK